MAEAWGAVTRSQSCLQGGRDQGMGGVAHTVVGAGTIGESVPAKGCTPKQRGGGRKIPVSPFLLLLAALEEPAGEGARDADPGEGRAWGGLTASKPTPAQADTG